MAVEASDGPVGRLDELMVDPASGESTHRVLGMDQALSRQETTLPVAAVDRVVDDTIHLTLTGAAVKATPALPASRRSDWPAKTLANVESVIVVFDDTATGHDALHMLRASQFIGAVAFVDAAVVVTEADGRAVADELTHAETGEGAYLGAIIGALAAQASGSAALVAAGGAASGGAIG
jgi:hypothetical protein